MEPLPSPQNQSNLQICSECSGDSPQWKCGCQQPPVLLCESCLGAHMTKNRSAVHMTSEISDGDRKQLAETGVIQPDQTAVLLQVRKMRAQQALDGHKADIQARAARLVEACRNLISVVQTQCYNLEKQIMLEALDATTRLDSLQTEINHATSDSLIVAEKFVARLEQGEFLVSTDPSDLTARFQSAIQLLSQQASFFSVREDLLSPQISHKLAHFNVNTNQVRVFTPATSAIETYMLGPLRFTNDRLNSAEGANYIFTDSDTMLILGGHIADCQSVFSYNLSTQKLTKTSALLQRRQFFALEYVEDRLYVFAGVDAVETGRWLNLNSAENCSVDTLAWESLPQMPCAVGDATCAHYNGYICIAGGRSDQIPLYSIRQKTYKKVSTFLDHVTGKGVVVFGEAFYILSDSKKLGRISEDGRCTYIEGSVECGLYRGLSLTSGHHSTFLDYSGVVYRFNFEALTVETLVDLRRLGE